MSQNDPSFLSSFSQVSQLKEQKPDKCRSFSFPFVDLNHPHLKASHRYLQTAFEKNSQNSYYRENKKQAKRKVDLKVYGYKMAN